MPLFIAVHKYEPQDEIAIWKEVVAGFTAMQAGKIPQGVKLCAIYETGAQRAFCVWEAPSKEALEEGFEKLMPTLKKYTEFVPVAQSYPPTMEYVLGLWQEFIKAASK